MLLANTEAKKSIRIVSKKLNAWWRFPVTKVDKKIALENVRCLGFTQPKSGNVFPIPKRYWVEASLIRAAG